MINSLTRLERHAATLDLRLDVRLLGRAGQLDRLADEEHAAIVEMLAGWLRRAGYQVEGEASFSEWGERGRIDLLAHAPRTRTVVIVEVKTLLLDLQELLGSLNVRERLISTMAQRRGWAVDRRITVLAVANTASNQKVVRGHAALFKPFGVRRLGHGVLESDSRVLLWITPQRTARRRWVAGRERVRPRAPTREGA